MPSRAAISCLAASSSVSENRTAKAQHGAQQDQHAENHERLRIGQARRLEQESGQDGARISTRPDDSRHRADRALVHERNDRIVRAIRHLHEQTREHHAGDGQRQHVHAGKQHHGHSLGGDRAAQQRGASAQAPAAIAAVADDAAQRAGEQIHHAESAGDDARHFQRKGRNSR